MKLLVLASLVALASANPQTVTSKRPPIRLLNYYFNQDGKGNYEYGYLQDNEQRVEEVGRSFPGPKPETGSISKEGFFEFRAPDEKKYRIDYLADEDGFQPRGDHLPVPPDQIPEYAQWRRDHPELFD